MTRLMVNPLRLALVASVVLTLASPARAQRPASHQTLTVTIDQAVGFLSSTTAPSGVAVSGCRLTVEGGPVRYWTDGTTPTTMSGHLANAGTQFFLVSYPETTLFRALATNGPATIQATCYDGAVPPAPASDASLFAANTLSKSIVGPVMQGVDAAGVVRALAVSAFGEIALKFNGRLPLPPCNPVRTTNCQPKGF